MTQEQKIKEALEVYKTEFTYELKDGEMITYYISLKTWKDISFFMEITCSIGEEISPVSFYGIGSEIYSFIEEYSIRGLENTIEKFEKVKRGEMYMVYSTKPRLTTNITFYKDRFEEELATELNSNLKFIEVETK